MNIENLSLLGLIGFICSVILGIIYSKLCSEHRFMIYEYDYYKNFYDQAIKKILEPKTFVMENGENIEGFCVKKEYEDWVNLL